MLPVVHIVYQYICGSASYIQISSFYYCYSFQLLSTLLFHCQSPITTNHSTSPRGPPCQSTVPHFYFGLYPLLDYTFTTVQSTAQANCSNFLFQINSKCSQLIRYDVAKITIDHILYRVVSFEQPQFTLTTATIKINCLLEKKLSVL